MTKKQEVFEDATMSELDLDEIALVKATAQPVNGDATIDIVKAHDEDTPAEGEAELTPGLIRRVLKAAAAAFGTSKDNGDDNYSAPNTTADTPSQVVEKAKKPEGSYEELRGKLADAIQQAHGGYHYVEATYPDHVVASQYVEGQGEVAHDYPYTVSGDNGAVSLGARSQVERVTSYKPVAKAAELEAAIADVEKADTSTGTDVLTQIRAQLAALRANTSTDQSAPSGAGEKETSEMPPEEITKAIADGIAAAKDEILTGVREEIAKARTEDGTATDEKIAKAREEITKAQEAVNIEKAGQPAPAPVTRKAPGRRTAVAPGSMAAALRTALHGESASAE